MDKHKQSRTDTDKQKYSCPCCGHAWEMAGDCMICFHLNEAEALAKVRYPEKGDQALSEVLLQRHSRRSSKVQEDIH